MTASPSLSRSLPLAARMAVVIGGFGLLGSAALVWWVLTDEAALSRRQFLETGKSNAAFLVRTGLPASAQMESQLAEVLGLEVKFHHPAARPAGPRTDTVEPPWDAAPESLPLEKVEARGGWEFLALPLASGREMWLARPLRPAWQGLLRPGALAGLGAFWGALLLLALGISRTVVRPLRALARSLPQLTGDNPLVIPPAARRTDEIGSLATGLADTHAQLIGERQKRLESKRLALLGRMAAGLAHEINNPAAAIRLHAQLLERALPQDSPGGGSARTIASEAGRIEELVNQWLFLTRPAPPQQQPVDLADLVLESLRAAAPAAEHGAIQLKAADLPAEALTSGDRRRLRQVLGNLITNAIQATPEGGSITVSIHRGSANTWEISCQDSGPGFSPAALEEGTRLFFTEKEGGLGIGLSVSAEIAAAHGGRLTLSNTDTGARAVLTLPALPHES